LEDIEAAPKPPTKHRLPNEGLSVSFDESPTYIADLIYIYDSDLDSDSDLDGGTQGSGDAASVVTVVLTPPAESADDTMTKDTADVKLAEPDTQNADQEEPSGEEVMTTEGSPQRSAAIRRVAQPITSHAQAQSHDTYNYNSHTTETIRLTLTPDLLREDTSLSVSSLSTSATSNSSGLEELRDEILGPKAGTRKRLGRIPNFSRKQLVFS
jgi:hypothetical protein